MRSFITFEIRYQLRQPATYIYLLMMFGFAVASSAVHSPILGVGGSLVKQNAPANIAVLLSLLTLFGTSIISTSSGMAIVKDFLYNSHEIFFTTGAGKIDYLVGRFLGAFTVNIAIFTTAAIGFAIGAYMPWSDKNHFGPSSVLTYLQPVIWIGFPNVFLISALLFTVGALTRSHTALSIAILPLVLGFTLSLITQITSGAHAQSALLDPFGYAAVRADIRYWTPSQINTRLLPIHGYLLWDRLLWTGIGAVILAGGISAFRFSSHGITLKSNRRRHVESSEAIDQNLSIPLTAQPIDIPAASEQMPRMHAIRSIWVIMLFHLRRIMVSVPFMVISAATVFDIYMVASTPSRSIMPIYPVTRTIVDGILAVGPSIVLVITLIYSLDLLWMDRTVKIDQITDIQPVSETAIYLGHLLTLIAAQSIIALIMIATGIAVQFSQGYYRFELPVYLGAIFGVFLPRYAMIAVLAFFINSIVNNRFTSPAITTFAIMLIFLVLPSAGIDHHLLLFASTPNFVYSDMNKAGSHALPIAWFTLYWGLFSCILAIITVLFWPRGTDLTLRSRFAAIRERWNLKTLVSIMVCTAGYIAVLGFIYYNTNILNRYISKMTGMQLLADYERRYQRYASIDQPRITNVSINVDLYPKQGSFSAHGVYTLENRSSHPIADIHVVLYRDIKLKHIEFSDDLSKNLPSDSPSLRRTGAGGGLLPSTRRRRLERGNPGAVLTLSDPDHFYRIYHLSKPLQPSDKLDMTFDVEYKAAGFANESTHSLLAGNGTFINNRTLCVPNIGYVRDVELDSMDERRKMKLPQRSRLAPIDDPFALRRNELSSDADWINFDATISTEPDQIAIAPGRLTQEWSANGRRYFHYTMDNTPILNFYSILSARYAVRSDRWKNVDIAVYYHPDHAYNIDKMISTVKSALTYCSEQFGNYQYNQIRIVEFPCYSTYAQSFPNTVPWSESLGFIAREPQANDIDLISYVGAHEISHQWWGHQVVGAEVQGCDMLSESLAQYSALMIMEHQYGRDAMRGFLRREMDSYLHGRGGESQDEKPLALCEHQQYIHYNKGSLAFYALRDAMGEDKLNLALRNFLSKWRYRYNPYPTSKDLIQCIRAEAPANVQPLITDLFERITLFDNRAIFATATPLFNGQYKVHLEVIARKLYADGKGNEKETPINDWIDIGVFSKGDEDSLGKPLYFKKVYINRPTSTFDIIVTGKPNSAGIDPYNKLIDRDQDDNVIQIGK